MRKWILSFMEWFHATLLLVMLIPLMYAIGVVQPSAQEIGLYFISLIIFLPIMLTSFAVKKCKSLFSYLGISFLILIGTTILTAFLGYQLFGGTLMMGYALLVPAETLYVIFSRFLDRQGRKVELDFDDGYDRNWKPSASIIDHPGFPGLAYFLAIYFFGKVFHNPNLCNEALISMIVYFFITFIYLFVKKTEEYLSLNKRVANLPSSRVYGIRTAMLLIFFLLILFTSLPSILTMSQRQYTNIRIWFEEHRIGEHEIDWGEEPEEEGPDLVDKLWEIRGPAKEMPIGVEIVLNAGGYLIFIWLIVGMIKAVIGTFHQFRNSYDDNGDFVEELDKVEVIKKHKESFFERGYKNSPREQVRREYRRMIRRFLKTPPKVYDTPYEIETEAGIADMDEMKLLHVQYEEARYGGQE